MRGCLRYRAYSLWLLHVCGLVQGLKDYYMENHCGKTVDISSYPAIDLHLTSSEFYKNNMDCRVTVKTSGADRMMYMFNDINIEDDLINGCMYDYLTLYNGSSYKAPPIGSDCEWSTDTVSITADNYLTLHFVSDDSVTRTGFQMILTKFHTGSCDSDEYMCDNGRCIGGDLPCNGYNPCGDNSDCQPESSPGPGSMSIVAVAVIIGAVVFIIIILFVSVRRGRRRLHSGGNTRPVTRTRPVSRRTTTTTTTTARVVPSRQQVQYLVLSEEQVPWPPVRAGQGSSIATQGQLQGAQSVQFSDPPPAYDVAVGMGPAGVQPSQ